MTRLRRMLLGMVFGTIVLGLVEIGLYFGGVEPAHPRDTLGWRMHSSVRNYAITDQQNQNTFFVNTNSDGLRSSITKDKPPHLVRVALTGDSTVFGWGVSDDDTLGHYLKKELRARNPKRMDDIEILNAGQPGYSSAQVYKLFEEYVQHYQPDWILAFPPFHDDRPVLVSDWESLNRVRLSRLLGVMLARYSGIYNLLYTGLKGPVLSEVDPDRPQQTSVRVSDIERTEIYTGIQEIANRWNAKVIIAAMMFGPDIEKNPKAADDYPMWRWIQQFEKDNPTIPILDLRHCCINSEQSYTIPGDPGHLNRIGNERIANCIAELWHPNIP